MRRLCILGGLDTDSRHEGHGRSQPPPPDTSIPLREFLEQTEKAYLIGILKETKGQVAPTYSRLGISRKSFYDKINKFAIDLSTFRKPAKG